MAHDDLVHRIYDAASQPELWSEVLDRVAEMVGARGCIIFEWAGHASERVLCSPYFSGQYDEARIQKYIDEYASYEINDQDMFEAASLKRDSIDLISDEILDSPRKPLANQPNQCELNTYNINHRAACLLNKDNPSIARFSIQTSKKRGPLNVQDCRKLNIILPHIAKSQELGRVTRQLAERESRLVSAMNNLNIGICMLDKKSHIIASNTEFLRQCSECDVFYQDRINRLVIKNPEAARSFTNLLKGIKNHGQFGARPRKEAIIPADGIENGAISIELAPLRYCADISSRPVNGAILYTIDTSRPIHCDPKPMAQIFGLTPAEEAIAELVAEGLSNSEISDRRNRKKGTINFQVKSILTKTNCNTRTQFARLMLSFGAKYTKL